MDLFYYLLFFIQTFSYSRVRGSMDQDSNRAEQEKKHQTVSFSSMVGAKRFELLIP